MRNDLEELMDIAIYKEIASQAFYEAGQKQTDDPGAQALMKDLAAQELRHTEHLKRLKDKGLSDIKNWHPKKVRDLRLSEYLSGGDKIVGVGLQDSLTFAIKREQQSVDFYSRMMGLMNDEAAKRLCLRLTDEELGHKLKLELLYDSLFLGED
jgi:rubrerythrin